MAERQHFPILVSSKSLWLKGVPWEFVEPHAAQCQRNHSQTLMQLAQRGGLDPSELLAVLEDRPWRTTPQDWAEADIIAKLGQWLQRHEDPPHAR